ncbi:hypothetical protein ILUMI_11233 [Ignelater luminosus]|uniref:DDE-1 domain-containing protein n=1 Tax=Ignelater luminosus TaxID=2038154 RepID=A0A8K0D2H3_IGNLU|nr:hypothetical protein ILUMI_11233 [Ignelater luminosus]
MRSAVEAVLSKEMDYLKDSQTFGLPTSDNFGAKGGKKKKMFGLTLNELRTIALELAELNNIPHTFNKANKIAEKEWLHSFLRKQPNLSLHSPEPTWMARKTSFHVTASKVLSLRDRRQIDTLVSGERGFLVTAEICMNASGNFMPTMFMFRRLRANSKFLDGVLPGSTAEFHFSGWMQKDIFLKWVKRFINFGHPPKEKPVLLVMDGYATHTKSIQVIDKARKNYVILMRIPPHTSHKLQFLHVYLITLLNCFYSKESRKWMRKHPAARAETAVNGFKKTGMWPYNPGIFDEISEKWVQIEKNMKTKISVVQYYTPTDVSETAEREFLPELTNVLYMINDGDILMVMGDLNTNVGKDHKETKVIMETKLGIAMRRDPYSRV